jgi:ubiquinone/menaquinone biosynthesis C-methylase UbiE
MLPSRRKNDPFQLLVGMTGVKLGDRIVQIGCAHGGRLGAVAARVGLSGHAAAIVPDESSASRARKGAAQHGVFVEITIAPPTRLALDDAAFDLAVIDETGGLLGAMAPDERVNVLREAWRVLKPGGRALIIGALPATGLAALLGRGPKTGPLHAEPLLASAGFTLTRVLGEREGLRFTEGVKRRTS